MSGAGSNFEVIAIRTHRKRTHYRRLWNGIVSVRLKSAGIIIHSIRARRDEFGKIWISPPEVIAWDADGKKMLRADGRVITVPVVTFDLDSDIKAFRSAIETAIEASGIENANVAEDARPARRGASSLIDPATLAPLN